MSLLHTQQLCVTESGSVANPGGVSWALMAIVSLFTSLLVFVPKERCYRYATSIF